MDMTQESNAQNQAMLQAQGQLILRVIKHANLDANNVEHQKAAALALKDVGDLYQPERKNELEAMMKGFGFNTQEVDKTMQEFAQQEQRLNERAQAVGADMQNLEAKMKKNSIIQTVFGVIGAIGAAVATYTKLLSDKTKTKKALGAGAAFIGAGFLTNFVAGIFTTKPVLKEAEAIQQNQSELQSIYADLAMKEQNFQLTNIETLAAKVVQSRLNANQHVENPAVEHHDKPHHEAKAVHHHESKASHVKHEPKSFTDLAGGADKKPAISPAAIAEQKEKAEHSQAQVG